jgi:hypothetical protein
MPDALRWAQSVHVTDGIFASASRRVASYFVTNPEVKPYSARGEKKLSAEERQKVVDFLHKTLRIRAVANYASVNTLVYSNCFVSLKVPFKRFLSCPKCAFEAPLERIARTPAYQFRWTNFEFHCTCPVPDCQYRGAWPHVDRPGDLERGIAVKFWNPHELEIVDCPSTDEQAYVWRIPEYYRRLVKEGKPFHLCRANWEIVQAIKRGEAFYFDPGVIHHMKDRALSGMYTAGWGIGGAIQSFRQAWTCQMLRRFNEAICSEYIIPFRVISPEPRSGADPASADPVFGGQGGAAFRANVMAMIRRHRRDPGQIQVAPVPLHYQMLGGEANQLAPYQLIDQATDALLCAAGVPAELYKGSLSVQAAPVALRLFESYWSPLVDELNRLLEWLVDRAAQLLNWEPVDAQFERVTTADDLNRQMALLQLMMNKNVSQTTGLAALGKDWKFEQDRLLEEQQYVAERTQEMQEDEQAKVQQQGLVPGVTQPQAGGQGQGQQAMTPEDTEAQVDQIAQQLLQMPESQRRSELLQLKRDDSTLHALVKQKLDEQNQRMATAGKSQLQGQLQQQGQGQPGAAVKQGSRRLPSMAEIHRRYAA